MSPNQSREATGGRGRASTDHLRPPVQHHSSHVNDDTWAPKQLRGPKLNRHSWPHTGRKRHHVFTHMAKAARPARTNWPEAAAPKNLSAQLRAGDGPECVNTRHTPPRVSGPPPHSPRERAGISSPFFL